MFGIIIIMSSTKFDKFLNSKKKANIVIIGGGPVGMMTAIALIEFNIPRIESITILEKRSLPFTREQIVVIGSRFLAIDESFLKRYGDGLEISDFISTKLKNELTKLLKDKGGCYIKPPSLTLDATCFRNDGPFISSPLKIIEESLLEMLKKRKKNKTKIKVNIIYNVDVSKIKDDRNTVVYTIGKDEYDLKYDILIGTDGKQSIVKNNFKKYFEEIVIIPKSANVFAGVFVFTVDKSDIKISSEKSGGLLNFPILSNITNKEFNEGKFNTEMRIKHKIFPQQRVRIFQHKEGYVYIGVSLTEAEFKKFENLKEKGKNEIPDELFKKIQSYLLINKIEVNRKTPVKFSFFPMIITQVVKPFHFTNNAAYFLGGDAGVNTHFFTASGLDFGLTLSIAGTANQIDYLLKEADNSEKANEKFKDDFINFDSAYSIRIENMYSPPRVSLDFSEITKKCENMTKDQLIRRGKKLGIDSLKTKGDKSLLDLLDKTELCYLIIDESIKDPFGKRHPNLKGLFPNFGAAGKNEEEISKAWIRKINEKRSLVSDSEASDSE